jgi:hypothetical protein
MTRENDTVSTNPLSGSFGDLGDIAHAVSYAHEESDPIIRAGKEILQQIPSGERLLEVMHKFNIPINTVKGRELTYNNPDDKSIFLVLPPHVKNVPELVALTIGCAIRDVEQGIVGFTRPDKDMDPVEFASVTFSKSLDVIVNMCQIADELKTNLGFNKPLDIIDELGHSNLYKAYKAEADHDTLVDIFVQGEYDEG